MKIRSLLTAALFLCSSVSFAEELPPLPKGPLLLTSTQPEQFDPEYWIRRLPNPNEVIKTPEEMAFFNEEILSMVPDKADVFAIPESRAGKPVKDTVA